jgi:hypothetical protein
MDPLKLVFLGWIPWSRGFQNGSPQPKNGSLETVSPIDNTSDSNVTHPDSTQSSLSFKLSIVNLRVKLSTEYKRPVRGMSRFGLDLNFQSQRTACMELSISWCGCVEQLPNRESKLLTLPILPTLAIDCALSTSSCCSQARCSPYYASTGCSILLLLFLSLNDVKWWFSIKPEFQVRCLSFKSTGGVVFDEFLTSSNLY